MNGMMIIIIESYPFNLIIQIYETYTHALARATILADDYRNVTQNAQRGDFIYLDLPYQPLNDTSNFTAYTTDGFDNKDQSQLAEVFRKLDSRGACYC